MSCPTAVLDGVAPESWERPSNGGHSGGDGPYAVCNCRLLGYSKRITDSSVEYYDLMCTLERSEL